MKILFHTLKEGSPSYSSYLTQLDGFMQLASPGNCHWASLGYLSVTGLGVTFPELSICIPLPTFKSPILSDKLCWLEMHINKYDLFMWRWFISSYITIVKPQKDVINEVFYQASLETQEYTHIAICFLCHWLSPLFHISRYFLCIRYSYAIPHLGRTSLKQKSNH